VSRVLHGLRRAGRLCRAAVARVERVVFAAQPPFDAGLATDLEHRLTTVRQVTGEPGAVVAGALDRPGTNAAGVPLGEAKRLSVASHVRAHGGLSEHRSCGSTNDSERVLIAVRVDTDHVIHLVCKHPDRSSVHSKGPEDAGLMQGNRAAGL
jgi:hypothetical protein